MKNCAAVLGIFWLLLVAPALANPALHTVQGRTTYHADDSRTESVRDPNTRELTETTYNATNALTVKKVFLLNEKGEPMQGNVYDGRGNLVARVQCIYDEFGRRKEDRLINLNGQVFQEVLHEYGKDGKALPPKVINLSGASAPSIKPSVIDFTRPAGAVQTTPTAPGQGRFAPVPLSGTPTSGASAPPTNPSEASKSKPNFFKRLFQKKEK